MHSGLDTRDRRLGHSNTYGLRAEQYWNAQTVACNQRAAWIPGRCVDMPGAATRPTGRATLTHGTDAG